MKVIHDVVSLRTKLGAKTSFLKRICVKYTEENTNLKGPKRVQQSSFASHTKLPLHLTTELFFWVNIFFSQSYLTLPYMYDWKFGLLLPFSLLPSTRQKFTFT